MVRDGQLLVIDSHSPRCVRSPWRQAVDLANMMLVLALRTDAPRVLARARIYFDDEEIAEAFAATRGLTMPSQLRRMLRNQGRDLHQQFISVASLPAAHRQDPTMEHAPGHAQHRRHRRGRPRRVTGHSSHREQPAMRRIAALCCLLPLLAGGCAGSISLGEPPARQPTCPAQNAQSSDELNPGVVLIAQSVPSASWLPCINPLPVGFRYERLEATNHGTHLWLKSGGEGSDEVEVSLSQACDLRGTQETRSAPTGMRRYQRVDDLGSVYRGKWFYVFLVAV